MTGPCEACGMVFMLPFTEWLSVSRGSDNAALLADLSSLTGAPGLAPGSKTLTLVRAYMDGKYDFDDTDGAEIYGWGWKSWAYNEASFTR